MTLSDVDLVGTAGPVAPWGSVGRVFIVEVEEAPLTAGIPLVLGRAPEPVTVAAEITGALVTVGAAITGTSDGIELGLVTWVACGREGIGGSDRVETAFLTGGGGGGSCQIEFTDACGTDTGCTLPVDNRGAAGPVASTVEEVVAVGLTREEVAIAARACLVN